MRVLVVGASAGLGRALTEALAGEGHDMVLVSSDERDVAAQAAHLTLTRSVHAVAVTLDLAGPSVELAALDAAVSVEGGVDAILFPIGWTATEDDGSLGAETTERLVRVNLLSVTALVARYLPVLRLRPRAAIVGFGSVAASRGRGANMVYASTKSALHTYLEGLRHACADGPVRVACYVPGFLDTNLAFGRRTPLPRARPEVLARRVVRDLGRREGTFYHPRSWRPLCALLRSLPWFVFRRLKA